MLDFRPPTDPTPTDAVLCPVCGARPGTSCKGGLNHVTRAAMARLTLLTAGDPRDQPVDPFHRNLKP